MWNACIGASASYTSLMDDKKVDAALTGEEEHDCEHRVSLKEDAQGVYCPICGDNQAARP